MKLLRLVLRDHVHAALAMENLAAVVEALRVLGGSLAVVTVQDRGVGLPVLNPLVERAVIKLLVLLLDALRVASDVEEGAPALAAELHLAFLGLLFLADYIGDGVTMAA